MQKPDIIGAFKLAAQRNGNLDAVKRSLIAAGYDVQDVEDSALAFSQGQVRPAVKPLPSQAFVKTPAQPAKSLWQRLLPAKTPIITTPPKSTAQALTATFQAAPEQQEKKEMPKYLLIAIISSVVIVLGLLGYVIYKIAAG